MERLEFGKEELKALASLLERIIAENSDNASAQGLRHLSAVWETTLELRKKLKMILRRSYE
jgi:hypothetical protein